MQKSVAALVVGLVFAACPRITVEAPDAPTCTPALCGAVVRVKTQLPSGTPLTAAECKTLCASVWCDYTPIDQRSVGCSLVSGTEVSCGSTAYDCGETFGGCAGIGGSACTSGCCDQTSNSCRAAGPQCTLGGSCSQCPPPDERCSLDACMAFKSCGGQLPTEPRVSACADADGGVDPLVDLTGYCPDACNAAHAGGSMACPFDGGVSASDGGTCATGCENARATCETSCPKSDYASCISCAARCGVTFGQCQRGC